MTETLLTAEPPAPDPAIAPAADSASPTPSDATATPPVPVADPPAPVVPAPELTYNVALSDGSILSTDTPERIVAFARAHGLSPDVAAKMPELLETAVTSHAESIKATHAAAVDQWTKASLADPAIGATPQERTANIEKGRAVIRKYAATNPQDAEALKGFLSETGQGSHPAAVRFFVWLGKQAGEGTLALPSSAPTVKKSLGEILYPDMANNYGQGQ